jgi:two-component system response regulator MprA
MRKSRRPSVAEVTKAGNCGSRSPVLVIDDAAEPRRATAELLRAEGFAVVTADDGEEALQFLRDGLRPCAILLDLVMPRMDGFCFRREQLANRSFATIPTAAWSSAASLRERAESLGLPFFHKLFDPDGMRRFVADNCRARRGTHGAQSSLS